MRDIISLAVPDASVALCRLPSRPPRVCTACRDLAVSGAMRRWKHMSLSPSRRPHLLYRLRIVSRQICASLRPPSLICVPTGLDAPPHLTLRCIPPTPSAGARSSLSRLGCPPARSLSTWKGCRIPGLTRPTGAPDGMPRQLHPANPRRAQDCGRVAAAHRHVGPERHADRREERDPGRVIWCVTPCASPRDFAHAGPVCQLSTALGPSTSRVCIYLILPRHD
jgi:hypothetical protein